MKTISEVQADFKKQIAARHLEPSDVAKLPSYRQDDEPFPEWDKVPGAEPQPPPLAPFASANTADMGDDPILDMVMSRIVECVICGDKANETKLRGLLAKYMQSTRGA